MNFIKKNWFLILIILITCVSMSSCSLVTIYPEPIYKFFNGEPPDPLILFGFSVFGLALGIGSLKLGSDFWFAAYLLFSLVMFLA